jgi:beta-glucanase (GH16 family)
MSHSHRHKARVGLVAAVAAVVVSTALVQPVQAAPPMNPRVAGIATGASAHSISILAPSRAAAKKRSAWGLVYNRAQRAAPAGTAYRASALVRAKKRSARATVRITQMARGHVINARSITVKVTKRSWRKVYVAIPASTRASSVQVWVKRRKPVRTTGLRVVRVKRGSAVVVAPSSPLPANPGEWKLDLSEDFDSLSSSRWNIKNNTYASNEDSYLLARNTSVGGGVLRIQGKLESAGRRNYTSGYVDTNGKYSVPTYFRAEVRAKVPFQQGLWAAPLWFRPAGGGNGEIDMVETLGNERARPTFHQTIHTEYGSTHKQASITKLFSSVSNAAATDWHTYTMEKTPGRITMWVDGVKTVDFTPANPSWYNKYYEIGKRWNLRVNMQIGGTWGGLPDSTTNWSPDDSAMQLDYIRTWVPN